MCFALFQELLTVSVWKKVKSLSEESEVAQWKKAKSLSRVWLLATPLVAYQAPQSMEFSRQEYWSGLPFPSPGDLPNSGIEPRSPMLQADALPSEPPGKPLETRLNHLEHSIKAEFTEIKMAKIFSFRDKRVWLPHIWSVIKLAAEIFLSVIYFSNIIYIYKL